jgi:HrpA-like RNA helicase
MGRTKNKAKKRKNNADFAEIQISREQLPVNQHREAILDAVMKNRTTILVGETGSGKTTQIPQILFQSPKFKKNGIVITQPRRVAAISLSKRVSDEMGRKLGTTVGYSIRFEDCTSAETKIKFVTDGMLLRELLSDPMLTKYGVIILDEAHERTLRTDVLFGAVKGILRKRNDLKVIVMSATLNAKAFSEYFDNAPIITIPGRQFPVTTYFAAKKQADYLDAALVSVFQIHNTRPAGDVLVFLTGQEEIENLEKLINEKAKGLSESSMQILVCPIFASLPTSQQTKVFEPTPPNTRKIVLSTNIAETSITISGIRYVVDTGMVKVRGFNPKTGIETLTISPVSKASANQRSGRAGREAEGHCFRLYTEDLFKQLAEETEPEITRCNLSSVLLLLKSSGIDDVVGFDFMEKPSRNSCKSVS